MLRLCLREQIVSHEQDNENNNYSRPYRFHDKCLLQKEKKQLRGCRTNEKNGLLRLTEVGEIKIEGNKSIDIRLVWLFRKAVTSSCPDVE